MQTELVITLNRGDMANISHLSQAWNLVGGDAEGAKKDVLTKRRSELGQDALEAKLFGKIETHQFTMEDIYKAVLIIKRRRDELLARLDDPVFTDPKLQKIWADGVRANANHGVRLAESFLEDLREDLRDHNS